MKLMTKSTQQIIFVTQQPASTLSSNFGNRSILSWEIKIKWIKGTINCKNEKLLYAEKKSFGYDIITLMQIVTLSIKMSQAPVIDIR
jgi:hypothetical protein